MNERNEPALRVSNVATNCASEDFGMNDEKGGLEVDRTGMAPINRGLSLVVAAANDDNWRRAI